MKRLIIDQFQTICNRCPNDNAIISQGNSFTYAEILQKVNLLAQALLEQGIYRGDRVALLLRNRYETVISYLAIIKIGAVEVALNPVMDSPAVLAYALKDCGAKGIISNNNHLKYMKEELGNIELLDFIFSIDDLDQSALLKGKSYLFFDDVFRTPMKKEIKVDVDENDLALIVYTSGTTGLPKGIMLTHLNIFSSAQTASEDIDLEKDKCLLLIPLYHAYGKQMLNSRLFKGHAVVFCENVLFPMEILNLIIKEKVSGVITVPAIYNMLIHTISKSKGKYDFRDIKYVQSGGANLSYNQIMRLKEIFPEAKILYGYGLTEAGTRVALNRFYPGDDVTPEDTASCGKPHPDDAVAIVDENGNRLKSHQMGEIIFHGAGIMKGYWNKEEETRKVLIDGWLYTGDLGKVDDSGQIFITDRKKDIIKSGGEIVSPKEIEEVVNAHPGIIESAVIGVPDELLGEKIKAYVVLEKEADVTQEEIRDLCSKKLPFSKIPSYIEFIDQLPKSTLAKVKKSELRKRSAH
jgi:long-chain acyl-CoA synthetase